MFLCLFLGDLCGLLPSCEPSSQQLHFVVELSSGIRDSSIEVQGKATPINPVDRLKEALSSKVAFQKYYLVRAAYCCFVQHTGANILNLSENSHLENINFVKIHNLKLSFFDKIHIFKSSFFTKIHILQT